MIDDNAVASQSSTCWEGDASKAIDGNTNGKYCDGSVQHNCGTENPWWKVDLGRDITHITSVKVYNRSDCCMDRINNTKVEILDAACNIVASQPFEGVKAVYEFDFSMVVGRSVRLNRNIGYGYLNIAEVEVFGYALPTSDDTRSLRGEK